MILVSCILDELTGTGNEFTLQKARGHENEEIKNVKVTYKVD